MIVHQLSLTAREALVGCFSILFSNSQWSSVSSYEHVAVFDKYNVGSVSVGVLFCWRVCGERLMVETSEVIIEESKYLQLSSENTSLSLHESRCL